MYVRDLSRPAAVAVSGPRAGFAAEPSLSADGRWVAYGEQRAASIPARSAARSAHRRARAPRRAPAHVAGVSATGAALRGWSGQPALSGDGRRVAFTTDATADPKGGPGGLQVMVRDLAARTTTTANPPKPLGSFDTGPFALQPAPGPLCSLSPPAW